MSGKNRQPWRFVVIRDDQRAEMAGVLREGNAKARAEGEDLGGGEGSGARPRKPVSAVVRWM